MISEPSERALLNQPWLRLLLRAATLMAAFTWAFTRPQRLLDSDSYLHLAIARLIGERGVGLNGLPWARFSALGAHYGDKELLFHIGLVPFVRLTSPEHGGKLALACLCAALAWTLWELGRRALGAYAFVVPMLVFGSGSFVLRALRLRPELASILLLLWVLWALAQRRLLLSMLLAFAFTLSHTAFHSMLGLVFLYVCQQRWADKRWHWQVLASVIAGVLLALLLHPCFPDNLRIFWLQNVAFFRYRDALDIGGEFQPHGAWKLLQLDGVSLLGLLALVLAREADPEKARATCDRARRMAVLCWIGTLAFGLLFLRMGRFATLAVPLGVLAVAFELQARGLRVGKQLQLAGRGLPLSAALALVACLAGLNAAGTAWVNWRLGDCFDRMLGVELQALGQRLPAGARVAANWDDAELYAFYAPNARYLNVFDPVFMAVVEPQRYAALRRVLAGEEEDVAGVVRGELDSEYLAFAIAAHPQLLARLLQEPRAQLLQRGRHALFRLTPSAAVSP